MKEKRVRIESSFHPTRQQYHLDGASRDIKFPRQRWFGSHEEMMAAIEKLNPDVEFV
jgi:hypothetical protein